MIYFIVLVYIVFLSVRYRRLDKSNIPAYYLLQLILILLAGLRYNVGIDTSRYFAEYSTFPKLWELKAVFIHESNYKILWIIFESTMRSLSDSFYLVQLVLAIFVNAVVFRTIRRYSANPFLTVLFYYLLFYLNINTEILRESVCICFLLLGLGLISKKQYFRYYLLAVTAFFFHESGAILFIVPILLRIRFTKKAYLITIIVMAVISGYISIFFVDLLTSVNLFNENKFDYFDWKIASTGSLIFNYLKYVVMPVMLLFICYPRLSERDRKFIFIYIIFSIIYTEIPIFYRVRDYFFVFYLIAVTNAFARGFARRYNYAFVKISFLLVFLFISIWKTYYNESVKYNYQAYRNYYPYNSIFDEDIPQSRWDNFRNANASKD